VLWLLLFFVVPMFFMGVISLETGSLRTGFQFTWQFSNFADSLSGHTEQLVRSFLYGGIATALALVIAYPLAYAIAFYGGKWKTALLLAAIAPFFTSYLIRTLAWQTILADDSPIVNFARSLGLLGPTGRVLDTSVSVIAGLTYNFLPFMILPIYASLERLDRGLIEAAGDLYASSRAAFLKVTLPLSAPGIAAGVLLTFIPAVGDFVNALFLGGPNQAMIGNVIQGEYLQLSNYPTAAALSFVLIALILVVVFAYLRLAGAGAVIAGDDEAAVPAAGRAARRPPGGSGPLSWLRRRALPLYAGLAIAYMLIPIAIIAIFSFNDPTGSFNISWQGFTWKYWLHPFAQRELTDAMGTSLRLAALSTVIATAIGTMLALALVRHRFRGRRAANLLIVVPMATPEVVIGAALLSMFVYLDVARGFTTLLFAHVMFSISYVTIVVRSRLIGFDRSVEEAAADLGAGPVTTFFRVTLPLVAPAIVASGLLAFVLSIDDFVISSFNSGTTVTFPLYIFGASQRGIPVEVNVIATMLFALTVGAMIFTVWQQRRAERLARPMPEAAPALYPAVASEPTATSVVR
jgi:spermidine/putrescine transport system permease protein